MHSKKEKNKDWEHDEVNSIDSYLETRENLHKLFNFMDETFCKFRNFGTPTVGKSTFQWLEEWRIARTTNVSLNFANWRKGPWRKDSPLTIRKSDFIIDITEQN